jgi:hypothetical protein
MHEVARRTMQKLSNQTAGWARQNRKKTASPVTPERVKAEAFGEGKAEG